jgi:K(+)-stimulated pyrophosphate-energized sodium pump
MLSLFFVIILPSAVFAIVFAFLARRKVIRAKKGDARMEEIHQAIREGAVAYLKRQYKVITIVGLIVAGLLFLFLNSLTALGFAVGAFASGLAGYLGMLTAVSSNVRVAEAAKKGLRPAFRLAFWGGSTTGFLVVGLALLVISGFWLIFNDLGALVGLGFGGSLISVFSRLGGGIYTKGADVGADLVGKIEAGIPEDDPRNPAVIADNVGDNVGDCAGMAADLFETYVVTTIAAMLLGKLLFFSQPEETFIVLPLLLGAVAIIASIIGSFFVRLKKDKIMAALYKGLGATAFISIVFFAAISVLMNSYPKPFHVALFPLPKIYFWAGSFHSYPSWIFAFLSSAIGVLITFFMVVITEYYTSKKYRPVQSIAKASVSGHGTNIITGLAVAMESTFFPVIVIALAIILAWWLFGLYGIGLAAVSMLSLAGIIIAIDSFGPITDNAGGIAEMAGLSEEVRKTTDLLDAVGNTTKAVTKGYAIASAALAALVLFASYGQELMKLGKKIVFEIQDPFVLIGIFLGASLPYIFASLSMMAVGRSASSIVEEVRRQFKEPKIMSGEIKPNYAKAVDIATRTSLKQMVLPALLPIFITIITALIFGPKALGGLLIGVIVSGLFVAVSMTSGGAAWDNAKKYIEEGNYGGKGSMAHKAAVTGDTVGDPYKDTAGPAINPMIKVVNIIALLITGLF